MGKIIVDPEEFFDIIMIFLFDIINNREEILLKNEDIVDILNIFERKGLKSPLMQYYLNLTSEQRVKYKRIRDSFYTQSVNESNIKITSNKDSITEDNENFYDIKDSIKRCISLMKKEKYNNPNRVITDDLMDKIITHVLKEKING